MRGRLLLTAASGCIALAASGGSTIAPLKLKQSIPLPGVEGRIDHFAIDQAGERLFVCALGNNSVEIVDLRKRDRVHSITGLGSPQGIAYVPEFNRLFVANDNGGLVNIYDARSLRSLGSLDLKDDADNVRYDEAAKKIYVGFGNGGIAIVDARDGKQLSSIKLAAHPEAFALEKSGRRIFVNVPTSRHVAVIDRDNGELTARWKTNLAFANFPIALDEANHRLFVGCRMPSKLLVLDTGSGNVVAKIDISGDNDDIFYDSRRRRIYAICGAGDIDVIEQTSADTYKPIAKVVTASGARTGLFASERDSLFIAVPHRGSQRAEIRLYQPE